MKKLYLLLGLVTDAQFELPVSRAVFVKCLQPHVAEDVGTGLDIFSTSNAEYKGFVGYDEFYLRKKRGFAKRQGYYWKASGKLYEENGQLVVNLEMRNFPPPVYFYFIVMGFFVLVSLFMILMSITTLGSSAVGAAFFNLFCTAILATILGAIIRSTSLQTIEKMKIELKSNFHKYILEK